MYKDFTKIAVTNLRQRSIRSWITTSGVVISVAAIIILVLVSNGLKVAINEQFNKLGSNRVFISARGGHLGIRAGLTEKDVDSLERIAAFDYITPFLIEQAAEVEYGREKQFGVIAGYPTKDADDRLASYDLGFQEGRAFRDGETNVALIGDLMAHDVFDREIGVRNNILINGRKFTVVGVLEVVGNAEDDKQIYIPLEDARELFNKPGEVSFIDVTLKTGVNIDMTVARIKRQLERDRKDENFRVMSPTQILKAFNSVLGIVQGILVSIASISLLVGAIGIMNMMFSSVLERTKEIGIMKSVGARNSDVLLLFVIEAGLIGFVGGLLGLIIGAVVGIGIGEAAAQAGFGLLKITLDPWLFVFALVFATVIGMVSGYLPARRAALLHPVDALRWT